jgi:diguanylate cyclase (GGDEF)-like protein/PAS domain S-box-containing protein
MTPLQFWTVFTSLLLVTLLLVMAKLIVRAVRRRHGVLAARVQDMQRLALVAERTSNWVVTTTPDRVIVWANPSAVKGLGLTLSEVVGKTLLDLVASQGNDQQQMTRLSAELDRGASVKMELLVSGRNGQNIWLDVEYQPTHDDHGKLSGFLVLALDITERVNERQKMLAVFNTLPVGVVVQSKAGAVVDCNPTACEILGLSRDQLLGLTSLSVAGDKVHDDLTPYPASELPTARTLRTGQGLRGESLGHIRPNGDMRWLMANTEPLRDPQGELAGAVSSLIDVTEQRVQQQLLALAVDGAGLGTWQWDIATDEITTNDRLLEIFGQRRGELEMTSKGLYRLMHPDDVPIWMSFIRAQMTTPGIQNQFEIRLRHGQGLWIWTMFSGAVVQRGPDGKPLRMAGVCLDVNTQKLLEEQLRDMARTDGLTQMPNRAVVMERVRAAIVRSRAEPGYNFAVLFMDFDRFKQVNDTLGHSVGDELLRQIAQRLQQSLRPGDAYAKSSDIGPLAARVGGDEFVVVLDDIGGDRDAELVASRLLDVLAQPYVIGSDTVNSSASIGIVTATHAADDVEAVLRDADIAMYEAKRTGRGRHVLFEPSMHKRVRDDVALEADLRRALAQDELFVVYQPLVDLASGALAGMEALVRWQHPQRGMVSPVEFIPVAEACGLITPIGLFVLQTACAEFAHLQALLGPDAPPSVSVNLSRAQLREPGLVSSVRDVLGASGMEAAQLQLEVTESLAAQDSLVQSRLQELKLMGVTLALDDFGTGYSSLSCLHELPVDTVKIDRAFVSMAQTSDYHRVLIEATILVAETLGMSTVAEGIETTGQADMMLALRCNKGQGYLYSKPLARNALVAWISAHALTLSARSG